MKEKIIIGWREYVDLPDWRIHNVRAKVDTGARTSSLHVEDIKLLKDDRISFVVIPCEKNRSRKKHIIAEKFKQGHVKSSTGDRTRRWYVKTRIRFGGIEREIVVNLIDRKGMNFRMLLGRTAIDEDFLVDVDRSFLLKVKKKGAKK